MATQKPPQTPVFTHDCTKCKYLGTTLDNHSKPHDWYVCSTSVVARHSSEGSDYWSMDRSMVESTRYTTVSMFGEPYVYLNEKIMVAQAMLKLEE